MSIDLRVIEARRISEPKIIIATESGADHLRTGFKHAIEFSNNIELTYQNMKGIDTFESHYYLMKVILEVSDYYLKAGFFTQEEINLFRRGCNRWMPIIKACRKQYFFESGYFKTAIGKDHYINENHNLFGEILTDEALNLDIANWLAKNEQGDTFK